MPSSPSIKTIAKTKGEPNGKLNIFPGWVNPGDLVLLKHYLEEMGVDATYFMDTEDFDSPDAPDKVDPGPMAAPRSKTSRARANAVGSLALARYEGDSAAQTISKRRVRRSGDPVADPLWHRATPTRCCRTISEITGKAIPEKLVKERGIAIDALQDLAHMFFANKKVAIFGHPDLVIGLARILPRGGA